MKAVYYVLGGILLIGLGYGIDKANVGAWGSNVSRWWNGPPSSASELCLSINESLADESAWSILKRDRNEYSGDTSITNGKLTMTCVNREGNVYNEGIYVGKKNVSDSLSAPEKVYLINKGRAIYKKLRYSEAINAFED